MVSCTQGFCLLNHRPPHHLPPPAKVALAASVPTTPWVAEQEPAAGPAAARWGWPGHLRPPHLLPQIIPCLKGNQVVLLAPPPTMETTSPHWDLEHRKNSSGRGRFPRSHTDAKKEKEIYIYIHIERAR